MLQPSMGSVLTPLQLLRTARYQFWDFDGVIKETVTLKEDAFVELFASYGPDLGRRIREHHVAHGGVSRLQKIPLYLSWVGEQATPARTAELCEAFGRLVRQRVLDAPWVPGVREVLDGAGPQRRVLVTATPHDEILELMPKLGLAACFHTIYGAPTSKRDAIRTTIEHEHADPAHCVMIGDSIGDRDAAAENRVPFLLRRHAANQRVFSDYTGPSVSDFTDA